MASASHGSVTVTAVTSAFRVLTKARPCATALPASSDPSVAIRMCLNMDGPPTPSRHLRTIERREGSAVDECQGGAGPLCQCWAAIRKAPYGGETDRRVGYGRDLRRLTRRWTSRSGECRRTPPRPHARGLQERNLTGSVPKL